MGQVCQCSKCKLLKKCINIIANDIFIHGQCAQNTKFVLTLVINALSAQVSPVCVSLRASKFTTPNLCTDQQASFPTCDAWICRQFSSFPFFCTPYQFVSLVCRRVKSLTFSINNFSFWLSYEACHYMYKIQGLCCWILSYYFIVVRETYQIYIMDL